jgi:hypothetical protein
LLFRIRICSPLILYFLPTYVYFRLQNAILLCFKTVPKAAVSKLSQKPSLYLNESFQLIFERRKIMYLWSSGNIGPANRKSENCQKYMNRKFAEGSKKLSPKNLRTCGLRNLFAGRPPKRVNACSFPISFNLCTSGKIPVLFLSAFNLCTSG